MGDEHTALRALAASQCEAAEIWQVAEWQCLTAGFVDRLDQLGLARTPEAGAVVVAAAMYLAERSQDWGGDARDALGDLVQLGASLLGEPPP